MSASFAKENESRTVIVRLPPRHYLGFPVLNQSSNYFLLRLGIIEEIIVIGISLRNSYIGMIKVKRKFMYRTYPEDDFYEQSSETRGSYQLDTTCEARVLARTVVMSL